jgi:aldehyde dehydrogenase (NAD+)
MVNQASVSLRHPDHFFIGGRWVKPSAKGSIDVRDSSTEEVFLTVAEAQAEDVDRAVAAARTAFDSGPWPRLSHAERADWLTRLADAWEKRGEDFAQIWTRESGVIHAISGALGGALSYVYREHAAFAETFEWKETHSTKTGLPALLVREPVGVVAAIVPWNSPNSLMAYKTGPALIAGCTCVVKASPEAPGAAYILAELCEDIGLPPGVINVLTADRSVSELLVRHPGVDKVSFTGSTAAGRRIASLCGDRIARCTLELGGKSPAVILDDYDVGAAAESISQTARFLTGQVCSSLTRLIITRERQDAFVEALVESFGKVRVGDPFDAATEMGPLAMERQRDRVEALIRQGVDEGARLATGGARPAHLNRGYYIEPTVFADVDNSSTIAREEIFGPVLSVVPADNEEHAIELANDTIYGLNASVFTNDPDRAYAVGSRLRAGTVGHNSWHTDFDIAFGGFKQSGLGREGGREGLYPYLEAKTMIFASAPSSGIA